MSVDTCEHASPRECDALYEVDRRFVCIDCLADAYMAAVKEAKAANERADTLRLAAGYTHGGEPVVVERVKERRWVA